MLGAAERFALKVGPVLPIHSALNYSAPNYLDSPTLGTVSRRKFRRLTLFVVIGRIFLLLLRLEAATIGAGLGAGAGKKRQIASDALIRINCVN